MRMGAFKEALAPALASADGVIMYRDPNWCWQILEATFTVPLWVCQDYEMLLDIALSQLRSGDVVVCMSNGGFAGVPARLAQAVN
jgi:UDP-N-acetylmuramate: L-alanyl-gamma-D-glutamyl-meso-diaminopimelate ligase